MQKIKQDENGNPDICRSVFDPLTQDQADLAKALKLEFNKLHKMLCYKTDNPDEARMLAIAKTNLEQASMWAVKAVTTYKELPKPHTSAD